MLLPYLCQPAEDELLYSWLGRVATLNRLGPPLAALAALFGPDAPTPSVDLPVRLNELCRRVPGVWHSPQEMIESGTLYPYYRLFSPAQHDRASAILLNGGPGGLRNLIGHGAGAFGEAPQLRYCPDCVLRDRERPGFGYWRRSHHLPGVRVCRIHGSVLIPFEGLEKSWSKRLLLPRMTVEHLVGPPPPGQLDFSRLSWDLLNAGRLPLNAHAVLQVYREGLTARGLTFRRAERNVVDWEGVSEAVLVHYGHFTGFMHRRRLLGHNSTPLRWLRALLFWSRESASHHPVCHLILIGFLFGSIESFLRKYDKVESSNSDESRVRQEERFHPSAPVSAKYRARWSWAITQFGSSTEAKLAVPAVHKWLYGHDRKWLLSTRERGIQKMPTVDWEARERELCRKVLIANADLFAKQPLKRMTFTRLRRSIGIFGNRTKWTKMPRLRLLLEELSEPVDAYRRRRVKAAILELVRRGEPLTFSRIRNGACLFAWSPDLREFAVSVADNLTFEAGR